MFVHLILLINKNTDMQYKNPTIIAEIGCNHKGDLNIAKNDSVCSEMWQNM